MATDLDSARDDQDRSEVFDEDNTNDPDRGPGLEAEQFEDLPDVFDATSAVGDDDDDEALIGDELDDDDIVALARDNNDDMDDLEEDDLVRRDEFRFDDENDLPDVADPEEDPDDRDGVAVLASDEVELEYAADVDDRRGARSAAQPLESDRLSDSDLRELDYKDEFTVDEDDDDAGTT
jgi:hypothetical protein